ncbi:TetR family transcriptional regulator [Streptomyces sp. B-S-A8]|uniref:TetR family transcriptional regulator n=1 Tax=Streptomyces solicavernae TaxID=3043614 RepID=A0ABT6RSI7_9ACTN|nr:TetR family transcriptional regulator [Streptomyces sp. B-S-A8]MDI3387410.1 TetR family transcriptional regulator [Streptomyces sp. B-S-A8]
MAARRYDPERRQRIIDAAIRVVGAKGIAGLSHRTVAAEADVPLGSTTYHFKTLDDLLVAALRQANEGFAKVVREHGGALADPGADLAAELARLTGAWLDGDRPGAELEYELYLAALRRPALRPVAAEWCEQVTELIARRTDRVTARATVALIDGVCLQVLLTGGAYDEAYAHEVLARVIDGPQAGEPRPDGETGSPRRGRAG